MKHRRTIRVIVWAAVVYMALCVVAGIGVAEFSLHLPRHRYEDGAGFRERVWRQFHAKVSDVQTTAADGAVLRGWYVSPPNPNGEAVVLLHGITGNRIDPSGLGDIFLQRGYSVLLPDSREHGQSGGRIATYGGCLWCESARRAAPIYWVNRWERRSVCRLLLSHPSSVQLQLRIPSPTSARSAMSALATPATPVR
jgi:hypothetical protein